MLLSILKTDLGSSVLAKSEPLVNEPVCSGVLVAFKFRIPEPILRLVEFSFFVGRSVLELCS